MSAAPRSPAVADDETGAKAADWNRTKVEEFRANGDKVGGQLAGVPLVDEPGVKSRSQAAASRCLVGPLGAAV